jgi:hypothetical protein
MLKPSKLEFNVQVQVGLDILRGPGFATAPALLVLAFGHGTSILIQHWRGSTLRLLPAAAAKAAPCVRVGTVTLQAASVVSPCQCQPEWLSVPGLSYSTAIGLAAWRGLAAVGFPVVGASPERALSSN